MDKIEKIKKVKALLVINYFSYLRKIQKGYPLEDKEFLKSSMLKLEYVETSTLAEWQVEVILDSILINLSGGYPYKNAST